jgi:hypothetical protein
MQWIDAENLTEQSATKVRAVASMGTDKETKETQLNHMIVSLQTAQQQRIVMASIWHCFLGPQELVTDTLACTKAFAERTKGQSGHKFGSPHVQAWRAFIKTLLQMIESSPSLKAANQEKFDHSKKVITTHLQEYEKAGVEQGHKFISQFRAKLSKDQKGIVNYSLSDYMDPSQRHELDMSIYEVMTTMGADYKVGSPPATDAERRLQRAVDDLRTQLGRLR